MDNTDIISSLISKGTPVFVCTDYTIKSVMKNIETDKEIAYITKQEDVVSAIDEGTDNQLIVIQDTLIDWEHVIDNIETTKASILIWKKLKTTEGEEEVEGEGEDTGLYIPFNYGKIVQAFVFVCK